MSEILDKIGQKRKQRIASEKLEKSMDLVRNAALLACKETKPNRFLSAINTEGMPQIIAEFKRASPSKGVFALAAEPAIIARNYESGGAAALSVLTEPDFFCGADQDLLAIKDATSLPILRKDFIIDEYQVYQSALLGADAILLIAAVLTGDEIAHFSSIAKELKLDVIVETHTAVELEIAIEANARIIGINNRNLRNFDVSVETFISLAKRVPNDRVLIAESGIKTREDLCLMAKHGANAALIGETLMRAPDQIAMLQELRGF
ncbi:MAG: indole-3-glycerol phosphate synthase TrpC [Pyrinomonadaceae bacterium]